MRLNVSGEVLHDNGRRDGENATGDELAIATEQDIVLLIPSFRLLYPSLYIAQKKTIRYNIPQELLLKRNLQREVGYDFVWDVLYLLVVHDKVGGCEGTVEVGVWRESKLL